MSTDPTNPPTSQAKSELDKVLAEIEAQFSQKKPVPPASSTVATTTTAPAASTSVTPAMTPVAPPATSSVAPSAPSTPSITSSSIEKTIASAPPKVTMPATQPMNADSNPLLKLTPSGGGGSTSTAPSLKPEPIKAVSPEPVVPSISTPKTDEKSNEAANNKSDSSSPKSKKPSLLQKLGGAKFVAGLTAIIIAIAGLGTSIILQQQTADNRSSANWCNAPGGGTNFGSPCEPNGAVNCGGDGVQTICEGNTWHATGGCCGEPIGGSPVDPPPTTAPIDNCPPGGICDPPNTCEVVAGGFQTGNYCTPTACGNRWLFNPGTCPITVAPTINPNPPAEENPEGGTGGTPVTVVPAGQQSCKTSSDLGQKTCQVSNGENTGFLCTCVLPNSDLNTGWSCNTRDTATCGTDSGEVYAQVVCKQRSVEDKTATASCEPSGGATTAITNSGRCISLPDGATNVIAQLYQCAGTNLNDYSNGCNTGGTAPPTNNGDYCLADNHCGVQQLDVQWSDGTNSWVSYISSADTVGCETTTVPNTPIIPPPPPVDTIPLPSPSPSPEPPPTPSPTPTPPLLACVGIAKSPQTPALGSSVTATCTPVSGATSYKFRTLFQGKSGDPVTSDLAVSSSQPNVSVPFSVNKTGTYTIQCAVCQGTNCTAWGSTESINSTTGSGSGSSSGSTTGSGNNNSSGSNSPSGGALNPGNETYPGPATE